LVRGELQKLVTEGYLSAEVVEFPDLGPIPEVEESPPPGPDDEEEAEAEPEDEDDEDEEDEEDEDTDDERKQDAPQHLVSARGKLMRQAKKILRPRRSEVAHQKSIHQWRLGSTTCLRA